MAKRIIKIKAQSINMTGSTQIERESSCGAAIENVKRIAAERLLIMWEEIETPVEMEK